ncbi:MAG TPA: phosphate ABC transporter permease PstA [Mycobacteriales bacterium]|nr:phosphate ABC transporter permease PstA [Mycobacteriales bacterium]
MARPKRLVRTHTFDDWMSAGGAVVGSLCFTLVVFEHLLDGSGTLGFLVSWFAAFLLLYAGLVALNNPRPIVTERLVSATLWTAAGVVVFALGSTIVYTFAKGWNAYSHLGFFIHSMAGIAPTAPLSQGGISHAIIGSVIEVGIAVIIAVPFGIGTAVYMSEVGGRFARPVRTVVEAMTALPEILAGLFVYVVLIVDVGLPKSGLAASIAMAVTMVPIIARAAEVALRVVPAGLREASLALGAAQWRTVWKVVLPSARAGLATATILGVARGVGETAVVLITSGASTFVEVNPTKNPMNSLPLFIYTSYATHEPTAITRAFGAASVLLTLVLVLFVATRLLSRDRKAR